MPPSGGWARAPPPHPQGTSQLNSRLAKPQPHGWHWRIASVQCFGWTPSVIDHRPRLLALPPPHSGHRSSSKPRWHTRETTPVRATVSVSSLQEGCPIPALTSWRCALRAEQRSQYERPSSAQQGASATATRLSPCLTGEAVVTVTPQSLVQGQFAVPAH